ncbi:MAG: Ig-like domain-containing protein [Cyclobacteriaceae bacterium]
MKKLLLAFSCFFILSTPVFSQCSVDYLSSSFTSEDLRTIYFIDANTGFIGGSNQSIIKTTDGGKNWFPATVNMNSNVNVPQFLDISFGTSTVGYAVGTYTSSTKATFFKTLDGGNTWNDISSAGTNLGTGPLYFGVYFKDANTGYAVGGEGKIIKTTTGGSSWSTINYVANNALTYFDIRFTNATTALLTGSDGMNLTTNDFASALTKTASAALAIGRKAHFPTATTGYVVGNAGVVKKTIDGTTWTALTSGTTKDMHGIFFTDATHGIIVGNTGTILRTTDGTNFSIITSTTTNDLYSVWFTTATNGYAVGDKGVILQTTDAGLSWKNINKVQLAGNSFARTFAFPSSTIGYYGLNNATIGKSSDGGSNWTSTKITVPSGVNGANTDASPVSCMHFFDTNNGVVITQANIKSSINPSGGSSIYKTTTGTSSWAEVKNTGSLAGTPITLVDVHFSTATDGWAVGNLGSTYKTTDGGQTWSARVATPGGNTDNLTAVYASSATTTYTAGGPLYKNTGAGWVAVTTPLFYVRKLNFLSDNVGWITGDLTNGVVSPSIRATSNGGSSWGIVSVPAGIISINDIRFLDASNGFVATDLGVYKTINGGTNWTQVTSLQSLKVSVISTSVGYADIGSNNGLVRFSCGTPCPQITGFSPITGPSGTAVVIAGNNLSPVSQVTFNGINAATFTVNNANQITATAPVAVTTGDILVSSPGGCVSAMKNSPLFTATASPTINVTGTLGAFSTTVGTPTVSDFFTVSGSNLTGNIVITPPAEFEVSFSSFAGGFGPSATITVVGGTVPNTDVHVRYNPSAAGSHSGNVSIASAGATTQNVPVSGTSTNPIILVSSIVVTGTGNATTISTNGGTLQMNAAVLPANATNNTVTWSITNGTGSATINASGLLTAVSNGTVTAKATANDGSTINGTLQITISNQIILVNSITVIGAGNATAISTNAGTLQMNASVLPANATDSNVTWSITNGTGSASINTSGLLTAVTNGTVTVKATANDASGVNGTLQITISNQIVLVNSITVTGAGNATTISIVNGTLQMIAAVLPANATNSAVTWTVIPGTGAATISASGLLTAVGNGTVTVKATAIDGSLINGTILITLSGQNPIVPVTSIIVTGAGNAATISTNGGTLQMNAAVLPANATLNTVTWSITNGTGTGTINTSGLLTAVNNGTVTVKASANDASGVSGTLQITISNQIVLVNSITVTGAGNATSISMTGGTLQMNAAVLPANATNNLVTWSVTNGTGSATINASGLLTATGNGTVTVKATANDASNVNGTLQINISGQAPSISVTSITVSGADISTTGGTSQMSASILPANATVNSVTWSVTNGTGSATINASGLLTATGDGTVTVKAAANDVSGVNGTKLINISGQSVCAPQPKPTITADFSNPAVPVLTSSSASGNQWYLNDQLIASETNKTLTVSKEGTYKVQTTVGICKSTFSDGFAVVITGDITSHTTLTLHAYPNPTQDYLVVEGVSDKTHGKVINQLGVCQTIRQEMNDGQLTIFAGDLAAGAYLLHIQEPQQTHVIRFIKL